MEHAQNAVKTHEKMKNMENEKKHVKKKKKEKKNGTFKRRSRETSRDQTFQSENTHFDTAVTLCASHGPLRETTARKSLWRASDCADDVTVPLRWAPDCPHKSGLLNMFVRWSLVQFSLPCFATPASKCNEHRTRLAQTGCTGKAPSQNPRHF